MTRQKSDNRVVVPSLASTPDEIRMAVERNALDRGVSLMKTIVALQIDTLLGLVDDLVRLYDKKDFHKCAAEIGIDTDALERLDDAQLPIPYPYYFCMPCTLMEHPELVFYYRNVAMLSLKVMRGIGLDTECFEGLGVPPSKQVAGELAMYCNKIVSELIKEGGITPYRHIVMMMASLGDSKSMS